MSDFTLWEHATAIRSSLPVLAFTIFSLIEIIYLLNIIKYCLSFISAIFRFMSQIEIYHKGYFVCQIPLIKVYFRLSV